MRRGLFAFAAFLAMAPSAQSEPFAAAITQDVVEVTSRFTGATVTVFGAVNAPSADDLDVVVAVESAPVNLTVHRQKRIAGFWFPADPVRFSGAPAFFTAASARPLDEITDPNTQDILGLDPADSAPWVVNEAAHGDVSAYRDALKRLKAVDGLYVLNPGGSTFRGPACFEPASFCPQTRPPGFIAWKHFCFAMGASSRARARNCRSQKLALSGPCGALRMVSHFSTASPALCWRSSLAGWRRDFSVRADFSAGAAACLLRICAGRPTSRHIASRGGSPLIRYRKDLHAPVG